jgi:hypothetical protein
MAAVAAFAFARIVIIELFALVDLINRSGK